MQKDAQLINGRVRISFQANQFQVLSTNHCVIFLQQGSEGREGPRGERVLQVKRSACIMAHLGEKIKAVSWG